MQSMNSATNPVYWYTNQVIITYYSSIELKLDDRAFHQAVKDTIAGCERDIQQDILKDTYTLHRDTTKNTALAGNDGSDDLSGIYIFPAPPTRLIPGHNPLAILAVPYTISIDSGKMPTTQNMASMPGNGGTGNMSGDEKDHTLIVIDHLHKHNTVNKTPFDAMPHWFWSGTGDETHGCPVSPPIPVPDKGKPGMWKMNFAFPNGEPLQGKTGEGVVVFVLDTLPPSQTLKNLSQPDAPDYIKRNVLLQNMITGIKSEKSIAEASAINYNYNFKVPGEQDTAKTGKDVYGRLVGFPMRDHGLSIAGIIRDLAPAAQIECIRVLNDHGVGDTNTLFQALDYIQGRVNTDLAKKPVIVNMSLVVVPPKSDWYRFKWDANPKPLQRILKGLAARMESLASQGVVFVASAGNDSDPRDTMMNPLEVRFGPRYPAGFLYKDKEHSVFDGPIVTTMIPVGAVSKQGQPPVYSNHPGPDGIGAYGGDLPQPKPWIPSAIAHINADVDKSGIDAICGVFTSGAYPALSAHDHYPPLSPDLPDVPRSDYPQYQIPQPSSWAFWSGTSFATPIISALAALVLDKQPREPGHIDVRKKITDIAQEMTWSGTENSGEMSGHMIMVTQGWNSDTSSKA